MKEFEDMDKSQLVAELTNERLLTEELQRNLSESMQEVLVLLPSAAEHSILELHSQIKRLEISRLSQYRAASAFDRARLDLKRQVTSLQDNILEERHRMKSELEEAQDNLAKLSAEAHTAHEEWRTVCSQLETRAARAEEMLATERQLIEDVLQRAVSEERQILQERLEEQQREAETKELKLLGRISELEEHVRKRDEALAHLEATAEEWQRSEWQEIKGKEERLKQLLAMSQGFICQSDLSLSIQLDFNEMQMADTERNVDALKIQLENIVQERSLLSQSVRMLGERNADLVNQLARVSAQIEQQASSPQPIILQCATIALDSQLPAQLAFLHTPTAQHKSSLPANCRSSLEHQALKQEKELLFASRLRQGQAFLFDWTNAILHETDIEPGTRVDPALAHLEPDLDTSSQDGVQDKQLEETLRTLGRLKRVFHVEHTANCAVNASGTGTASNGNDPNLHTEEITRSVSRGGDESDGGRAAAAGRDESMIKVDERML